MWRAVVLEVLLEFSGIYSFQLRVTTSQMKNTLERNGNNFIKILIKIKEQGG